MTGSPAVGAWIAHIVFWSVVAIGLVTRELSGKALAAFLGLWLVGSLGLPRVGPFGGFFVTPYVAVLDVVLALVVFKGNVRLT